MRKHFKLYTLVTVLAVMLSAWSAQSARSAQSTTTGDGIAVSSQSAQSGDPVVESFTGDTTNVVNLSPEELNNRLNGVNLAPPITQGNSTSDIVGPNPGTDTRVSDSQTPRPLPSVDSSNPSGSSVSSGSFFSTSIRVIGDWLLSFVKSLFNG